MSSPSKKGRLPIRGSTLLVFVFLAVTILPAFVAFALTPKDAQVVTNVQGWNGCAYTVRRGDDLFRIGVRYGVTYQYLAQLNGIYNPNYIYAGQTISVPCGAVPYVPNYRPSNQPYYPPYQCPWCQPFDIPPNCGPTVQYTVQPGDNLFRIAVTYGSTIQWIRTQNTLWGKVLRPGVVLNVPCQGYVKTYPTLVPLTPGQTNIYVTQTPTNTQAPSQSVIHIKGGTIKNVDRNIKVGTTVLWQNDEAETGPAYVVQSMSPGQPDYFNSGAISPGQSYPHTYNLPGTYPYTLLTGSPVMGTINVSP